jgi:hypothetical protein
VLSVTLSPSFTPESAPPDKAADSEPSYTLLSAVNWPVIPSFVMFAVVVSTALRL